MSTEVIVYRYDQSPYATKVENILLLRNIPYSRVNVPVIPPRPQLLLLGIPYRRIPVLAIGNDVYCDTQMIALALERAFPPSAKHPSIFSTRVDGAKVDATLQLLLAYSYSERSLFSLAKDAVPWSKVPAALSGDRYGDMVGMQAPPPDYFKKLEGRMPITRSSLATHIDYLEQQLQDGRNWLFDTAEPSYADVSTHMTLAWSRSFRTVREVFDKNVFPHVVSWMERFDAIVKQCSVKVKINDIEATEARNRITSSTLHDSSVGFDHKEAERLSLSLDTIVAVAPDDTGKIPTVGKLVVLSRREVAISVDSPQGGKVIAHFPRLGYTIRNYGGKEKSKL